MFTVLIERLKHLPGKHDQSSHGKPGRVGTAFRGAYRAARDEGKTHREAHDTAKTAAEQVRQTIRDERRAEREANPKPKRVAPPRVQTVTTPEEQKPKPTHKQIAENDQIWQFDTCFF